MSGCARFNAGGEPCTPACRYHLCPGDLDVPLDQAVAQVDAIVAAITAERPPIDEIVRRVETIANRTWSETRWSMWDAIAGAGGPTWQELYQAWLHS